MEGEIRRSELPFPWPDDTEPMASWEEFGELRRFPGALTVGTTAMTAPGTSWVLDGVLAFYQDRISVFLYDGRQWAVSYGALGSFRLRRGLVFRKLTLHGTDGETRHFRIGKELAVNARYILSAKLQSSYTMRTPRGVYRESPDYANHIASCPLCFADGGPYPFEPCPEGKEIMWASMNEEPDS